MEGEAMTQTWTGPYRNHRETVLLRLAGVLSRLGKEMSGSALLDAKVVYRRRRARVAAGTVGAIVGAASLVCGLVVGILEMSKHSSLGRGDYGVTSWVFGAGLMLTAMIYGLVRIGASAHIERLVRRRTALSGHPEWDLSRLSEASPLRDVRERAAKLERASLTAPLVALALLAPLAIHGAVYAVVALANGVLPEASAFGWWIGFSALCVGHAHIVFAGLSARFARKIHEAENVHDVKRHWVGTWGWTILAAAIPSAVLYLLPPIVTAATGICIIVPAFAWARKTVTMERLALAP
jgi:hypothetical protein